MCMCICICIFMCICIYVYVYLCVCIHVYVYICICIFMCVYTSKINGSIPGFLWNTPPFNFTGSFIETISGGLFAFLGRTEISNLISSFPALATTKILWMRRAGSIDFLLHHHHENKTKNRMEKNENTFATFNGRKFTQRFSDGIH